MQVYNDGVVDAMLQSHKHHQVKKAAFVFSEMSPQRVRDPH
jgi:hypothetical protein